MSESELEVILKAAFNQCESADCPLSYQQKQVLRQTVLSLLREVTIAEESAAQRHELAAEQMDARSENPLDQLSAEERQVFLEFVQQQESQNQPWKITLLNDWLQGKDSGPVQFIRERYGVQWLDQIQPVHLAHYNEAQSKDVLKLKVGDRIEVTNGLWEWVQETGPCSRQWFPCTVVSLNESTSSEVIHLEPQPSRSTSCVIRFEGGEEYEIQGIYDWNRPNWRWPLQ